MWSKIDGCTGLDGFPCHPFSRATHLVLSQRTPMPGALAILGSLTRLEAEEVHGAARRRSSSTVQPGGDQVGPCRRPQVLSEWHQFPGFGPCKESPTITRVPGFHLRYLFLTHGQMACGYGLPCFCLSRPRLISTARCQVSSSQPRKKLELVSSQLIDRGCGGVLGTPCKSVALQCWARCRLSQSVGQV